MNKAQEPTVRKTLTVATSTSRIPWRALIGLVAVIVAMSVVVLSGQELKHVPPAAPSFTVLHSFTGGAGGANPIADLTRDAAGNLYGTTFHGGAESGVCGYSGNRTCGLVFELIRCDSGYDFAVLHTFKGGADGGNPAAGLLRDTGGNLYGTTYQGGASNGGVVFKLSPSGNETVLYSFTRGADGYAPQAGLIQDKAGNLYGTTTHGGHQSSACNIAGDSTCGVVFKVSPTGTETVLYSFTGGADGGNPAAGLVQDAAGNLYGTTYGGGASGNGVVFKVSPTGTQTYSTASVEERTEQIPWPV